MYKVINGIDKHEIYSNSFYRIINEYTASPEDTDPKPFYKRLAFYGVMMVITAKKKGSISLQGLDYQGFVALHEEAENNYIVAKLVIDIISELTPAELINVFPVDKTYDGAKREIKDYFYTMDYLKGIGIDKPILENINYLLWEYDNMKIRLFSVSLTGLVDVLLQLNGEPGMMEQFTAEHGLKTYTVNKEEGYILDNQTGRTKPLLKNINHKLHLVK